MERGARLEVPTGGDGVGLLIYALSTHCSAWWPDNQRCRRMQKREEEDRKMRKVTRIAPARQEELYNLGNSYLFSLLPTLSIQSESTENEMGRKKEEKEDRDEQRQLWTTTTIGFHHTWSCMKPAKYKLPSMHSPAYKAELWLLWTMCCICSSYHYHHAMTIIRTHAPYAILYIRTRWYRLQWCDCNCNGNQILTWCIWCKSMHMGESNVIPRCICNSGILNGYPSGRVDIGYN